MMLTGYARWRALAFTLAIVLAALALFVGNDAATVHAQTQTPVAKPTELTVVATANDYELALTWKHKQSACKAQYFSLTFEQAGDNTKTFEVLSRFAGDTSGSTPLK